MSTLHRAEMNPASTNGGEKENQVDGGREGSWDASGVQSGAIAEVEGRLNGSVDFPAKTLQKEYSKDK
jgi:hypothetical protein